MQTSSPDLWHGTTILTVRKGGMVAIGGDGQVSIGQTIVKANAKKVRRLGKGDVIGGFAGATADAFTLFERLEAKLEQYPGQLMRAAVELAKDWRTDRYLRRLEAMMIVADKDVSLVLTGTGDVLEPEAGVMGIGSGGNYALAAARALVDGRLDAEAIVRRSLDIAADICVYTNRNVTIETLNAALIRADDQFPARWQPMTCRWCATGSREPHVQEWWGDPDEQFGFVSGDLVEGRDTTQSVPDRGRRNAGRLSAVWFIGHHQNADWNAAIRGAAACRDTLGIDQFDRRARHARSQGIGSAFIRGVRRRICSQQGTPRVVIDPDPANARAIRAYEKAGFRPMTRLRGRTDGVLICSTS